MLKQFDDMMGPPSGPEATGISTAWADFEVDKDLADLEAWSYLTFNTDDTDQLAEAATEFGGSTTPISKAGLMT